MRGLGSISDSIDMNSSKIWEIAEDIGAGLVSGTLCEDFGMEELITMYLDFLLDGLDVYNWVEIMNTGTNLKSFWGRI